MENKCPACGFVNPESAGFCFLCGVPFLGPSKAQTPTTPRTPGRVKGESGEIDDLSSHLTDDEDGLVKSQEELLKDLARLVPDGADAKEPEDLDGLLSDFDGSSRPSLKMPTGRPARGTQPSQAAPKPPDRPGAGPSPGRTERSSAPTPAPAQRLPTVGGQTAKPSPDPKTTRKP